MTMASLATIWNRKVASIAIYAALVVLSIGAIWVALGDVADRYASVHAAEKMLAQLEGRSPNPKGEQGTEFSGAPTGSPFIEGKTLTLAGAALLQRVVKAVNRIGGDVVSSQVDLQGAAAKQGWVTLTVSCDVDESGLQPLLYDIEAGMPFLFIKQLLVQGPTEGLQQSRMHIVLDIIGQWRGDRH